MTTLLVIRKEMVQKCVVYGCSNTKDEKKGISIHTIPFFNDSRPEHEKKAKVDFLRECHAEELDSIQTLGDLFSSFLARRLQPLVL